MSNLRVLDVIREIRTTVQKVYPETWVNLFFDKKTTDLTSRIEVHTEGIIIPVLVDDVDWDNPDYLVKFVVDYTHKCIDEWEEPKNILTCDTHTPDEQEKLT